MANTYNQRLGVPVQWTPPSSSGAATTLALSSANNLWSAIFKPEDITIAIRYLGFTVSATIGTPPTYRASIQTVDASGNPTGTVVGGGTPCSQTFTPPGPTAWNNTHQKVDVGSGNAFTPSAGTLYALVIEYSSGTIDASNMMTLVAGQGQLGARFGFVHYRTSTDGGSTWSKQSSGAGIPPFSYAGDTSRTYGIPYATFFTSQFSSNTAAASGGDERGGKFTLAPGESGTYEIAGAEFLGRMGAAGGTFDITLYEGTTVRAYLTIDTDAFQGVADYQVFSFFFDTPYVASFGTAYILAIKSNNTGQNIAVFGIEVSASADRAAFGFGLNGQWVFREDAGAWDESNTTRVPCIWPIVNDITATGGGGSGTIIIKRGQSMDLRQSTAATVPFGRFQDTNGAPVTGLTIQKADVRIKKAGGDAAAASADQGASDAGAPHDEGGVYDGSLNTTDTNTVGPLSIYISETGAVPWEGHFNVLTAEEYDAKYSTGARRANVTQISGDTTAADNAESFFDGTGYAGTNNVIPTVTNLTNAPPDSAGVTTLLSRIPSALFSGITSLAQWLGLIAGKQVGNTTARNELRATGAGSGTFDETTDSLEAIKDDAATLAQVATEMQGVIEDNHLDHLLAVTYDPASKPGAADALLNELVESDAGVARFTANALEQAPTGAGGDGSAFTAIPWNPAWDAEVQSEVADALDAAIPGSPTANSINERIQTMDNAYTAARAANLDNLDASVNSRLATAGYTAPLDAAGTRTAVGLASANLDTQLSGINAKTTNLPTDPADASDVAAAIAALNNISAADVLTQVNAALNTAIAELGVGAPAATPTLRTAVMLLYMNLRNRTTTTETAQTIQNDAGTTIATAVLSDDGTTMTKAEFA